MESRVKAYKAIYDAFVSKTEKAMRENASGQESLSACALKVVGGLALGVPVTGALSAVVKGVCPSELDQLPYQVSWAVIALCILKKDVDSADLSQFNGLLQDAHSHGMKRVAFRSVTYDPNYFWKTYLHERVAKILGLGSINEGDVVVEAPKRTSAGGGGEGDMHEKEGRKELTEQEKRRACKEALYAQWNPFYKAKIKSRFLDVEESGLELAGAEAWHDHDTIVSCVESVRDFVWRLDFDLGPLDVKEIWSEELHYMKHRYTTERPVDSWYRTAMFDLFVFLPRIWKLVLLSFICERKGDSSVHRIDTKYIVLLLRKALENRTWEKWFEDHFRRLNEKWIWVLLTISALTLDLDSALTSDEDDARRHYCEGWWD